MGIILKQGSKATIISYLGACLGALTVIFIYPKCLTPEQVGLTRVLLEAALFFAAYAQLGMPSIIIKYFPHFKDSSKNHNGFFFIVVVVPLIGLAIYTLMYFLFKEAILSGFSINSNLLLDFYLYLIPLTLFVMYNTILESYSSMLFRIVVPKIIKELAVRILTIALILLLYFRFITLKEFITYFVAVYGIAMLLNLIYVFKLDSFSLKPNFKFIDKNLMKSMGVFMLYLIVVGSGSSLASKIDIFMITTKINLANTGIYTIAFYIAAFIEIPSRAIFQITTPFVSEALKNNSMEVVSNLYKRVALNQLIISGFLLLLIWINADNIFAMMPNGHIYQKGKYVILFIGISKVIDAATGLNGIILGYSKYYYYTLFFIFFLAGLAIVNNMIFIPLFGINGAALATAITVFLYNALLIFFVQLKFKTQPFNQKTIIAIIVILLFFIINSIIHPFNNEYIDAIIRSSIISILFILTILKLKISEDINNTFNSFSKKYLKNFVCF